MCVCLVAGRGAEADAGSLQSFSILFFEVGSLTEHRARNSIGLSSQFLLEVPMSASQVLGLQGAVLT